MTEAKLPPTPEDLLAQIMGSPLEYNRHQVADLAGVDLETTRTLWRALGFADVGDASVFTKADVDALKSLMRLVNKKLISFEEAVDIARGIGQSTARLAEWQIDILSRSMESRGVVETAGMLPTGEVGAIMKETRVVKPVLERLMVYSWRRQMAAGAARDVAIAESGDDPTDQLSVGFADLVGFTRLSRQIPEEDLAQLVQGFEAISSETVAATGARLVKTLGDEVLFVDTSVEVLAETALRLHESLEGKHDFPKLRIGIATGSVVQRMGDVFGITVNRASRLTTMARPASTYVDAVTMADLETLDAKYEYRAVRPRRARGFGLMRAWALTREK